MNLDQWCKLSEIAFHVIALLGGCLALYKWWVGQKTTRARYLKVLLGEFNNESIQNFCVAMTTQEGVDSYFDGSDNKKTMGMRRTLRFFSYLCHALEAKLIEQDEFGLFRSEMEIVLSNRHVRDIVMSAMTADGSSASPYAPLRSRLKELENQKARAGGAMRTVVCALMFSTAALVSLAGDVTVTAVTARQRYPWNGLVDVAVTMQGSAEDVALADCIFAATNSATKAAIAVAHIEPNGVDAGSGTMWTRKFVWDAKADVGAVKIDDVALTVEAKIPGVQLWEGGPYWAECNVGATKPEECGYYFWWGDTVGYKRNASNDGWVSVKNGSSFSFSSDSCPTCGKDNSQLQSAGYIDATGNLVAAHDAATAHLGAPWRMPTDAELSALVNNCWATWTTRNGMAGRLVTGKGAYASRSIFLPAAGGGYDAYLYNAGSRGLYRSSTPSSDNSHYAWALDFYSDIFHRDGYGRHDGQSVRPVRGFAK